MIKEFFQIPNLLSLSRIILTPVIGYYLWRGDNQATLICVILLIVAAVTDGLDGYLARRLGQVSNLGIALDPVADKIFAGVLVVLLIFYRDFPLWLAAVIVGRDLLIILAGLILMKGRPQPLPSNLTGKYAFGAIAVLLGAYVIQYDFGIWMTTWLTVILVAASTVNYAVRFVRISRGGDDRPFEDKPVYKYLRVGLTLVLFALFLYRLGIDLFAG